MLDVTDPTGDDNGPGTYQYPTDSDFVAGSFDLTRFQVLSDGTFVYLRATLANLVPTFGAIDGAQLLDVYVHVPGARHLHAGRLCLPQLHHRAGRSLEPAGRGAGIRVAGLGERRGHLGRHRGPRWPCRPTRRSRSPCPRRSSAPRHPAGPSAWC